MCNATVMPTCLAKSSAGFPGLAGGGLSFFCVFLVPPTTDMRHTRHAVLLLEMKGRWKSIQPADFPCLVDRGLDLRDWGCVDV